MRVLVFFIFSYPLSGSSTLLYAFYDCYLQELLLEIFCARKVFHFHSDITNPDLWVDNKKSKDCSGLIFTQDFHNVYIKQVKADQILLPQHGSIYIIDGGYLEINKNFADTCE